MGLSTSAILLVPLGLFLKPITAEFGWSRTEFSIILAIAALANALILPVAGYLVDRFKAPRVIAVGTVLGCCGYAALSLAHSYAGLITIMVFVVVTGNLAGYPAFLGLTQRWFDKHLGLALAITSTGLAVGTGAFSYVIVNTIALRGWRAAFLTVGIAALVIGLANLFLFVRDNDGPLPEPERREDSVLAGGGVTSLSEALRTRDFWLYACSFALVLFAVVGCNFHLPALLSDHGASASQIAAVFAAGSVGSLAGRLSTGIMLDRFSVRLIAGLFFSGQAIGLLLLLDGLPWALLASLLLGAVQGAEIDMLGYVVARRFGQAAYGQIVGACFGLSLVGAITGPLVMAKIFDRTGSYDLGLMIFPLFPVLALGLLWLAKFSPQPEATKPE
jgi:nitrate/nitrite transporter NarK